MASIKSYTDIEQSKKLAEILPLESADMQWFLEEDYGIVQIKEELQDWGGDCTIPCWSLAALLGVLQIYTTPTAFSTNISVPSLTKTKNGYSITYVGDYRIMESNNNDIESPIEIIADNPIDACVNMVIKLNKLNLL